MDIHFLFPISADITLCGELAEDEPVVTSIEKATCDRCRELIKEISRQALFDAATRASEIASKT